MELIGKYNRDCVVYNDHVEESALSTIYSILDNPVFKDSKIRIMPDVHDGKGIVIGFTCPLTNHINPNHVGVDIGCTIDTWITNIPMSEIDLDKLKLIEHKVRKSVPFGTDVHERKVVDTKEFLFFLNKYIHECRSTWPEMIQDRKYTVSSIDEFCNKVNIDAGLFWKSIGTVGGGNHFIEFGEIDGKLAYTIHCGSRNLGVKIAKYHCRVAERVAKNGDAAYKDYVKTAIETLKKEGRVNDINSTLSVLKAEYAANNPVGYLSGEEMSDYLTDMTIGLAYALYNHETISKLIMKELNTIHKGAKVEDTIRSIHNYVDMSDHIIRKGSVRAYKDELMVIPFNMRDGLAICKGKGNPDWNYSCSHGAGRSMSRAKAKAELDVNEFVSQMEGIVSTSVGYGTIDEAPGAYKSTDEIMGYIKDTCDILYMVKPLINLKAKDTSKED